jgi:hypothetical protein
MIGGPFQPYNRTCQAYLIVCVLIRYQVDLTGEPDQAYLSGLPASEWLAL